MGFLMCSKSREHCREGPSFSKRIAKNPTLCWAFAEQFGPQQTHHFRPESGGEDGVLGWATGSLTPALQGLVKRPRGG